MSTLTIDQIQEGDAVIQPVFQRPTDLCLAVSRTAIPASLTILTSELIRWRDVDITFSVLGESHDVIMRRQGHVIHHELLSCAQIPVGDAEHLHYFVDEQPHTYLQGGYNIDVTMSDAALGGTCVPPQANLFVGFPSAVEGSSLPFTSISWTFTESSIIWSTIHLYVFPDREVAVHSRSEWK